MEVYDILDSILLLFKCIIDKNVILQIVFAMMHNTGAKQGVWSSQCFK